jgi:hypothetical protein
MQYSNIEVIKYYVRYEVFHGVDYEECRFMGSCIVWLLRIASNIRVTIGELGTTLAVTSNRPLCEEI